jgi:hypothetical protein
MSADGVLSATGSRGGRPIVDESRVVGMVVVPRVEKFTEEDVAQWR